MINSELVKADSRTSNFQQRLFFQLDSLNMQDTNMTTSSPRVDKLFGVKHIAVASEFGESWIPFATIDKRTKHVRMCDLYEA